MISFLYNSDVMILIEYWAVSIKSIENQKTFFRWIFQFLEFEILSDGTF